MLGAAFSALALLVSSPHTVWTGPGAQAFALDGSRMAWISGACRTVRLRTVSGGKTWNLGSASRTECDTRGTPIIALAGKRALWTELTFGNFTYTYLLTRAAGEKSPAKQIDYLVHENDLDGEWIPAMAGDGSTLVYLDLLVNGKTLPDDSDVYFADSGSLRRVVGRKRRIVNAQGPPLRLSVAGSHAAVVYADRTPHQSVVLRATNEIRILDLHGTVLSTIATTGAPRAVALTPSYVAALIGNRVAVYRNGTVTRTSAPVFAGTDLDASGRTVVGRAGRAIWALDATTGTARRIATAAGTPIGLSIEGHTVAWAENVHGHGRIRTVSVG